MLFFLVFVLLLGVMDLFELAKGVWVAYCGRGWRLGSNRLVKLFQAVEGRAQVAVVEGVRMHLHEDGEQVQSEEDLRSPSPVARKRQTTPEQDPAKLVQRLDHDASAIPLQDALAILEHQMQR